MISIVIIRTYLSSSRVIHLGMWLYCILRRIKPERTFNHAEIRIGDETSGAIGKGVKTRNWDKYWSSLRKAEKIEYKIVLTEDQLKKGLAYLKEVENTKYEFSMFFFHFLYILTGKWYGSRSNKYLFCYEHVIKFLNSTGKYYIDPYINPYEFKIIADKIFEQDE